MYLNPILSWLPNAAIKSKLPLSKITSNCRYSWIRRLLFSALGMEGVGKIIRAVLWAIVLQSLVNKEAYVTLLDGDVIRFGMSTRLYQFQAPSEYKHIQETDAPIQLLRSGSTPLDADSLTSESNWTFDHVTKPWILKTHLANAVKVDDIRRFLVLQHVEKLDLPFIAMCTREDCPSLFKDPDQLEDYPPDQDKSELNWHKILWAIQDLDLEWLMLQKRKRELKDRCQKFFDESRRPHDKMRQSLYKKIFQSSMKFLESANSEREVEDVETKFIFHFNQDVLPLELHNVAEEDIWKQMWEACQYNVKSVYSVCSKAGLWRVAYNFGPSSEELGLQLSREMNVNELEEPEEMPLEIAARFTSDIFRTLEDVLKSS